MTKKKKVTPIILDFVWGWWYYSSIIMYELGKKGEVAGAERLKSLSHGTVEGDIRTDFQGRPTKLPPLNNNERVIAGLDCGVLGESIIVCESLDDMQTVHGAFARGGALRLNWYKGDDPGFVIPFRTGETK